MTELTRRRRPAQVIGAVVVTVALLVATAVFLGSRLRSPEQVAAQSAPPTPSVVTAKAERRLLAEPLVARGTVVPGPSTKLRPPVGAVGPEAVVTAVPLERGDSVQSGTVLTEQAGQPVIALRLPFPLYRDITADQVGPDVAAVQKALRNIGYGTSRSGRFDATTQRAVRRLLHDRGYAAENLQSDSTAPAAPEPAAPASPSAGGARATTGIVLRRAWIVRITKPVQRVTAVRVRVGDILSADSVLAELDGSAPSVRLVVDTEQAPLLNVGQAARAVDETSKKSANLRIARISEVAGNDAQTGLTGIPVTLSFSGEAMPPSDRTVRVEIAAAATSEKVLAVPVTGVYSRPDGSQMVTVVDAAGALHDVAVTTGDTGGGWVAITSEPPTAVADGTRIVVGQS